MERITLAEILVSVLLTAQLAGLAVTAVSDRYLKPEARRRLLIIMLLSFGLITQNLGEEALVIMGDAGRSVNFWRTAVSVAGYVIRPAILVMFIEVIDPDYDRLLAWLASGLNAAVYLTAFFSHLSIWFEGNRFHRGPLGYTCHLISAFLLVQLMIRTFRYCRERPVMEWLVPAGVSALVVGGTAVDLISAETTAVSFLTAAVVTGSIFYYIWLHVLFVREHETAMLTEQRMRIMISQIQPHFLYNTLSTIQALCLTDPSKAYDTTEKFGQYLRQNIDSLDETDLIPFPKELEHTQIYAEIEQIRFPSIRIDYNIEDDNFSLPALTVQPMVENAVRHGVRSRAEGRISVTASRVDGDHVIEIRDNGRGFDPEEAAKASGTHIGIRNVRERLETMCGGELTITSRKEIGTTVTIRIPGGKELL